MKIAIDLTQIPGHKTGMGIYAVNLVKEMCKLNRETGEFHFIFFLQDDDGEMNELVKNAPNSTHITIKSKTFRKLPARFFFEQYLLPKECKKLDADLIFSFHYTMPYFTSINRVVIIPDMTFFLFPHMHQRIKRLYFRTLIPRSIKKSNRIITISESTKKDILAAFPHTGADKIKVIHLGVDPAEKPRESDRQYLEKYDLRENKYFLFVGTLEPRKNIISILRAFHSLKRPDGSVKKEFKLVIVGKKGWFYNEIFETVRKLKLEDTVIFTGYAPEEEKQVLLRNAYLFVYPSFYEGFGIPVIEAMACGVPVITGNTSSLPEVAGDAALLITPNHWQEIAAAMVKLLRDKKLYEKLSAKSIKQAEKFSWQITAKKTLQLFAKVGSSPPPKD